MQERSILECILSIIETDENHFEKWKRLLFRILI